MLKTMINAWKMADLRKKILFTFFIIIVFRIGSVIPVPFLDIDSLKMLMESNSNNGNEIFSMIDMLSGGAFAQATLLAMGVSPYINASIIMQLLTVAIPPLERMSKEGEDGRKRISKITRYVTVAIGLIQGTGYYVYLYNNRITIYTRGASAIFAAFVIVFAFTAGTALMMWLGEQINQKGIGNGISILLFTGIVARMPATIGSLIQYFKNGMENPNGEYGKNLFYVPLFVVLFLAVVWVIVFMNDAERRLPIQYAKRVVGRKMYGGQSSYIPIKVALAGVMPIIFASSILQIPSIITAYITPTGFWEKFFKVLTPGGWVYSVIYFFLIIAFAYFYVAIQYNPIEMANNLRQNNGTIPGIRPGKSTADFISKILSKITLIGALFLAVIAILPIAFGNLTKMTHMYLGGTSVIILVGVALETVKQMESQMMMRHYKGFLD